MSQVTSAMEKNIVGNEVQTDSGSLIASLGRMFTVKLSKEKGFEQISKFRERGGREPFQCLGKDSSD